MEKESVPYQATDESRSSCDLCDRINFSVSRREGEEEVGGDYGDEGFEASGSDFDDFDGDDTDDELGDGIVKEEKSKEDDEKRELEKAHRIGLEEAMRKVNKIKNCFQSATKGIGKDELVLNWYDVEKDLKFRYLTGVRRSIESISKSSKKEMN